MAEAFAFLAVAFLSTLVLGTFQGPFSGDTRHGRRKQHCVVCQDWVFGYFDELKEHFRDDYRARDGNHPCCRDCWGKVGLEPWREPESTRV